MRQGRVLAYEAIEYCPHRKSMDNNQLKCHFGDLFHKIIEVIS